ncbi:hypothetical protein P7996_16000, partial [Staphylococcus aureus]|nr:hypothetical protein [Staphylococcus aureus]
KSRSNINLTLNAKKEWRNILISTGESSIANMADEKAGVSARVQAMRRRKVPGWGVFTNKALQGGGSLIDYGCHLLDLSLWL